jgi:hypothetical protein
MYHGDIRSIMFALTDIITQRVNQIPKTLTVDEALFLLGEDRWKKIEGIRLASEQKQVLLYIAQSDALVTQKTIAKLLDKAQANISGYYFKPLKNLGIIEVKEIQGREKYYGLTQEYIPLKEYARAKKSVQKSVEDKQQLALFK